ncbi:MAG: squalene synthase HpnC [Pirellulales bacterium]
MVRAAFAKDLAAYGPDGAAAPAPSPDEGREYCRRLAATHYENFTVASWLLPRGLKPHFHNLYAWCRWADDLADETGDPARSLQLLDWWQRELDACYAGQARHPVTVALAETIRQFDIPAEPFHELLSAFRQDQQVRRYESFDDLLEYCRRSANPVGRLVLYVGGCHDRPRGLLADSVCTGLQLANFCQDVAGDWDRGRIYIPLNECRAYNYDEQCFGRREASPGFRRLLELQVQRAEDVLRGGLPLVAAVPRGLAADVWLFIHGGLAILSRIRASQFDVWNHRPQLTGWHKARLLGGCLFRKVPFLARTAR